MQWNEKLIFIRNLLIKLHNPEKLTNEEIIFCKSLLDTNVSNTDIDTGGNLQKKLLEEERNLLINHNQFGLIRRNDPKAGFGSYVFTILRDIYTCLMDNRIPIIDLESCRTSFDKRTKVKIVGIIFLNRHLI